MTPSNDGPVAPLTVPEYRAVAERVFADWEDEHGRDGGVVAGTYTLGSRVHLVDVIVRAMVLAAGRSVAEARAAAVAEARTEIFGELTVGGTVSVEDISAALDRVAALSSELYSSELYSQG